MIDPRERFSATAGDYVRHRPGYPPALVEWLLARAAPRPGGTILDLGCGTGISTRLLAGRGFDVVGVDPNETMLAHARSAGGGTSGTSAIGTSAIGTSAIGTSAIGTSGGGTNGTGGGNGTSGLRYARGEATATGLDGASVDLAVSAQAFHWFDLAPTLRELGRVLRPGGACAAFWNVRARTAFLEEYEATLRSHVPGYVGRPHAEPTMAALRAAPGVEAVEEAAFENRQALDREGLLGRARSSSYVAHLEPARRAALEGALGELFSRHERGGSVELEYRTAAILWRFGPPGPPPAGPSAPP